METNQADPNRNASTGKFVKGHKRLPNAGRKAGLPNKRTVFVQGMLEDAVTQLGGLQRLLQWIKAAPENEYAFWTSMFMRLLPVQIQGTGEQGELVIKVAREELEHKLEERGLSPIVIGRDVPTIDAKVIEIANGNGDAREPD